jgi:hypothetical protein
MNKGVITMGQQLDLAKKRLFDKDALAVNNIKMFPGSNRYATAEQFAEQINKSLSQIEAGDYDEVSFED